MNSTLKKPSYTVPEEVEAIKQDIQKTKETLQMTDDSFMKPILTELLKAQSQCLIELETQSTNTRFD